MRKTVDLDADGTVDNEYHWIHDGDQAVLEFDGDTASDLSHRYLWGPAVDQLLADETADNGGPEDVLWPLTDWQGSVRHLATYDASTDTTTVANEKFYDAYGNVTSETNSTVDTLFGYTGRFFDDDTGLQWNRNRWYDATVGRWLSEDPIDFLSGDPNWYRYVGNSPADAIDSDGLKERKVGDYRVKGTGHHVVPVSIWDEFGFDPELYEFLDNYRHIRADTHNNLGHGKKTGYTAFVQAELRERLTAHLANNRDKRLAVIEQKAFLKKFIDDVHEGKVKRKYISAFNKAAEEGTERVERWLNKDRKLYPAYADCVAPIAIRGLKSVPASKVKKLLCFLGDSGKLAGKKFAPLVGAIVTYNEARARGDSRVEAAMAAGLEEANPLPIGYSEIQAAGDAYDAEIAEKLRGHVHGPGGRFQFDENGEVIMPSRHLP
jgi:RHS repeat-associated protein